MWTLNDFLNEFFIYVGACIFALMSLNQEYKYVKAA